MYAKLAVLACIAAVGLCAPQKWYGPLAGGEPADKYPAGISPAACPNYPHCTNPAVAATAVPGAALVGYYGYAPASPVFYGAGVQERLNRGEYIGDGDYRGEGLAESGAFGAVPYATHFPYSYPNVPAQHPFPHVPADVHPASCPNYPYCF